MVIAPRAAFPERGRKQAGAETAGRMSPSRWGAGRRPYWHRRCRFPWARRYLVGRDYSTCQNPVRLNCFSRSRSDRRKVVGPAVRAVAASVDEMTAGEQGVDLGGGERIARLDGRFAGHHVENFVQEFFLMQDRGLPARRAREVRPGNRGGRGAGGSWGTRGPRRSRDRSGRLRFRGG